MITAIPAQADDLLTFKLSGKLHASDYDHFVPLIDEALAHHDKLRLVVIFEDFHGWDMAALWEDVKFDAAHFTKFRRIALVGDAAWEKWMAAFCKPFTTAKIRFFTTAERDDAQRWAEAD